MNNPAEWRPSGSRFNLTDDSSYNLEEASSTEARTEKECVVSARQRRSGAAERPKTGGQISGMFGKFKRDGSFCLTELKWNKPSNPSLCPSPGLSVWSTIPKQTKREDELSNFHLIITKLRGGKKTQLFYHISITAAL